MTVLPSVTGDGVDMLLRGPLFRSPVATCFCQRTLPVLRSTQISDKFFSASGLVTKTVSFQIAGVAWLAPGIGTVHFTFSVVLHVSGRFFSVVEPLSAGPRHCGQFSADTRGCGNRAQQSSARKSLRFIALKHSVAKRIPV